MKRSAAVVILLQKE